MKIHPQQSRNCPKNNPINPETTTWFHRLFHIVQKLMSVSNEMPQNYAKQQPLPHQWRFIANIPQSFFNKPLLSMRWIFGFLLSCYPCGIVTSYSSLSEKGGMGQKKPIGCTENSIGCTENSIGCTENSGGCTENSGGCTENSIGCTRNSGGCTENASFYLKFPLFCQKTPFF